MSESDMASRAARDSSEMSNIACQATRKVSIPPTKTHFAARGSTGAGDGFITVGPSHPGLGITAGREGSLVDALAKGGDKDESPRGEWRPNMPERGMEFLRKVRMSLVVEICSKAGPKPLNRPPGDQSRIAGQSSGSCPDSHQFTRSAYIHKSRRVSPAESERSHVPRAIVPYLRTRLYRAGLRHRPLDDGVAKVSLTSREVESKT